MTREMYLDGYHSIWAIDYSKVVIEQLKKRDKDLQGIQCSGWQGCTRIDSVMDCFDISFPSESFDVVIDKSMLDTFLCSEATCNSIPSYFNGVKKVLKPGGVFLVASFNSPDMVSASVRFDGRSVQCSL